MALPASPVWVRGDAARLDQILGNLLNNASKFTPDGGRIWLQVEREAPSGDGPPLGTAVLRVRDNGLGIEPEMLPRIFELFVQGSHTAQRMRSGVGIGLTLVKRLVELHGGSIEARSEGRSKGSEFTVRLPLAAAPAGERALSPGPSAIPIVQRVLLVDDNRDAIEAMHEWLDRAASEVRVAYDGTEALALAESFKPQVVLLDIGLPDMSGYDVARKLRAMPATSKALLIAITGFGRPEDIELSRDAGFDEHLTKPADPGRLMRLIGRHAAVEA
jgi:CheY-like chemotaxis protein